MTRNRNPTDICVNHKTLTISGWDKHKESTDTPFSRVQVHFSHFSQFSLIFIPNWLLPCLSELYKAAKLGSLLIFLLLFILLLFLLFVFCSSFVCSWGLLLLLIFVSSMQTVTINTMQCIECSCWWSSYKRCLLSWKFVFQNWSEYGQEWSQYCQHTQSSARVSFTSTIRCSEYNKIHQNNVLHEIHVNLSNHSESHPVTSLGRSMIMEPNLSW